MKNGVHKNGNRTAMPGARQASPAAGGPPALPAGGAVVPASRFDFRAPAVRDLVASLLERPDVQALQLEKPQAVTEPVMVGVRRRGAFAWFSGRSLFAALMQAEDALSRRMGASDG